MVALIFVARFGSLLTIRKLLVGTPGRILDHIGRHTLKLEHLDTLVLDEADEMLDMGFIDDIEKIVEQMPTERQTLLFSRDDAGSDHALNQQVRGGKNL